MTGDLAEEVEGSMSCVPPVKVCCIQDLAEAQLAIDAGAWALGLVAEMPSGIGPISDERIAEVAAAVPKGIETFLLTSRVHAKGIIDHHRICGTTTLQLVDHVPRYELRKVRDALPDVRLVQVIHVTGEDSVAEAQTAARLVDMILLDSGNPALAVKELGGTGRTHNWAISTEIVRRTSVPVFLAGGLRPENVADAITQVQPWGVDLCSGIRTNGKLDALKLNEFFSAVEGSRV